MSEAGQAMHREHRCPGSQIIRPAKLAGLYVPIIQAMVAPTTVHPSPHRLDHVYRSWPTGPSNAARTAIRRVHFAYAARRIVDALCLDIGAQSLDTLSSYSRRTFPALSIYPEIVVTRDLGSPASACRPAPSTTQGLPSFPLLPRGRRHQPNRPRPHPPTSNRPPNSAPDRAKQGNVLK